MSAISVLKKQIKDYVDTADERTLEVIHRILEVSEKDPLGNMSEEDKASVQLSLKQAKAGNVIPHADVKKEYEKWLTK
jgi:hypothetical protein